MVSNTVWVIKNRTNRKDRKNWNFGHCQLPVCQDLPFYTTYISALACCWIYFSDFLFGFDDSSVAAKFYCYHLRTFARCSYLYSFYRTNIPPHLNISNPRWVGIQEFCLLVSETGIIDSFFRFLYSIQFKGNWFCLSSLKKSLFSISL